MKNIFKIFIPSAAAFLLNIEVISAPGYHVSVETKDMYNRLRMFFLGTEDISSINIYRFLIAFFPIIIFPPIWGTYLSKDLNGAGIYELIRYKSRGNWYTKRIFGLILLAAISSLSVVLIIDLLSEIHINCNIFLLKEFISVFVIMYFFAVIQNIFTIIQGTIFGFIYTYGLIILGVIPALNSKKLLLSPINLFWNNLCEDMTLGAFFGIAFLQVFTVTIIGFAIIKRYDIGLNNKELQY